MVISKAHSFADGNKRTALLSMVIFLYHHGFDIDDLMHDDQLVKLMIDCAAGSIDEKGLYDAIFEHLVIQTEL